MAEKTIDGAAILKQAKKAVSPKLRRWAQVNVQNRNVSDKLNELSASGHTIFSVNQSVGIGGTYEVIYYIDRPVGDIIE
jgi:hypothetical protein